MAKKNTTTETDKANKKMVTTKATTKKAAQAAETSKAKQTTAKTAKSTTTTKTMRQTRSTTQATPIAEQESPEVKASVVGDKTEMLKSRFKAQNIPLESDFASLIDVADCGRKAVGLSPDQGGPVGPSSGLMLGNEGRLIIKNANKGLVINEEGLAIDSSYIFTKGMIMMFSGSSIPNGWVLCDGYNGTPNLIDKFILGGKLTDKDGKNSQTLSGTKNNKSYSIKTTSATVSVSGTSAGTTLALENLPDHSHETGARFQTDKAYQFRSYTDGTSQSYVNVSTMGLHLVTVYKYRTSTVQDASTHKAPGAFNKPHTHSISLSSVGSHQHEVSPMPPYYILAFIMKL